jgi:hypothetical protein
MQRERVAFLLGSGFSCSAGLPDVDTITDQVTSGNEFVRFPSDVYGRGPSSVSRHNEVQCCRRLLAAVRDELGRETALDGAPRSGWLNYENLSYLIRQVLDDQRGDVDNPLARRFGVGLRGLARRLEEECRQPSIWKAALDYIHDVVDASLQIPKDEQGQLRSAWSNELLATDHLRRLLADLRTEQGEAVDFFSLNHDLLMEHLLRAQGVSFVDGFSDAVRRSGLRYWRPRRLKRQKATRLFKLHGSVDWRHLRLPPGRGWWDDRPVILPEDGRIPDGAQPLRSGRSALLIGTHDKIADYTRDIFADLFCLLRAELGKVNRLVVCGYGFADKGINAQLIEWVYSTTRGSRRLVVVDLCEDLPSRARGEVGKKWQSWTDEGVLGCIWKDTREITWPEIRQKLFA